MNSRCALTFAALCVPLTLIACAQTATVHFKVTVTVDDGGTLRQGDGVWEMGLIRKTHAFGRRSYEGFFHGEAIPIALPGRGYLFYVPAAYLPWGPDGALKLPEDVFYSRIAHQKGEDRYETLKRLVQMRGAQDLTPCTDNEQQGAASYNGQGPDSASCMMLAFTADPKRPEAFKGMVRNAPIPAPGPKIKIRSVKIEITDAPVTDRIRSILPWLTGQYDFTNRPVIIWAKNAQTSSQIAYLRR